MSYITDEQRDRIWPHMNEIDPTVGRISSIIASYLWRGGWPPSWLDFQQMERDLQIDAAGVLMATLDVIDDLGSHRLSETHFHTPEQVVNRPPRLYEMTTAPTRTRTRAMGCIQGGANSWSRVAFDRYVADHEGNHLLLWIHVDALEEIDQ